jgi:1-acyl-sn-glycerol-3-phosphate acyltransferase
MKILWSIINFVQITIICIWTVVCALLGIVLMLFSWNGKWVHKVDGLYFWSPLICAITGVRVKIIGKEKIDRRSSYIYIANHVSHFDIVALARVMPVGLFFIAKQELAKVPFLGQYMHFIGHIFVDRKNKERAMQSMKLAAQKINGGKNVISFPEGTRSKTGELQIFKRGSFIIAKEGNVNIVPIGISGSRKILPSGSYSIRPGIITVHIGEVIGHEQYANMSVEQLAEYARTKVKELITTKS